MKRALDTVNERILAAYGRRQVSLNGNQSCSKKPKLIAVSKLKPISSIIEAYECGQRYFGENYIQELVEKSNSSEIIEKCPEIKFHFIGHLQSNKVNKLLKVRNLYTIETVDSIKLADLIDKAIERINSDSSELHIDSEPEVAGGSGGTTTTWQMARDQQLRVLIQVNTSGEEQKNGIEMELAEDLAEHIANKCRWLNLAGLMTIGKYDGWGEGQPNLDFRRLLEVRERVSRRLSIESGNLELSMGMSADFEEAVEMGSTSVRVGTMIFGERPAKRT